jgi:hypothetical protein
MRALTSCGWSTMSKPQTVAEPAGGLEQGREHPQRGRLAGAVRSEEGGEAAGCDVHGQVAHGDDGLARTPAEVLAQSRALMMGAGVMPETLGSV